MFFVKKRFKIGSWTTKIFVVALFFWCIIILSLGAWNYHLQTSSLYKLALEVARDNYNKDILYREWATIHGGVYAPITPSMQPNPYLIGIPERDISTPSGKKLTLINPAYMTRQVFELADEKTGTRGHITSLNPIRPENSPDEWERKSLVSFNEGETESVIITKIQDKEYFRFMRPMITIKGCLHCHAKQGYKEGDIRGGISVSIPWASFKEAHKTNLKVLITGYSEFWAIGVIALIIMFRFFNKYLSERKRTEKQISVLLAEKELLLKEVHHRIKNNMSTIKNLLFLQADGLKDPSVISALHDAEGRIESMMVLYDKLYRSSNFRELSIKEYLPVLVQEIVSNFPNSGKITIIENIDNFMIAPETLFPIGIIANEIITNIMKYAFTERDNGVITIHTSLKGKHAVLTIEDDGVGLPESFDIKNSTGFGMQLIMMLTEQLNGTLKIERENGTKFIIGFKM